MKYENISKPTLQSMHELIIDMFKNSCEVITQDGLTEQDYKFAEKTILLTLEYLKNKRLP